VWANAYLSGEVNLEVLVSGYGSGGSEEHIACDVPINSCRASEEMEVEIEVVEHHSKDKKGNVKAVVMDEGPCNPLHLPKRSFIVSL
jgi:hypothetical protein